MRATVHPDYSVLLIGINSFVDGNQLMGDRISLFPYPRAEWPAMDIRYDVHLTFMLRQR